MQASAHKRFTGYFPTPTLWVDEAHKMITDVFGPDWKDKYVVWDPSSGTNNLTRDYAFRELYCSTLEQGDVDTVKDMNYNPGSTVFQYDFLSEMELGPKVPAGLRQAFEQNRPILFFFNPPFGTANENGARARKGKHKRGIAKTIMNGLMLRAKLGACSQQLYAQFMYRVAELKKKYGLTDYGVAVFSPALFISGESFIKFREHWESQFSYADGMLFQASHFADVGNDWGVSFTLWR